MRNGLRGCRGSRFVDSHIAPLLSHGGIPHSGFGHHHPDIGEPDESERSLDGLGLEVPRIGRAPRRVLTAQANSAKACLQVTSHLYPDSGEKLDVSVG